MLSLAQLGSVAGLLDGSDQPPRHVRAAEIADRRALGGEIDIGLDTPGTRCKRLLDPVDAGGAGHAFDRQIDRLRRGLVARRPDRVRPRRPGLP